MNRLEATEFVRGVVGSLGEPTIVRDDQLYHTRRWKTRTLFGDPGSAEIIVIRHRDRGNTPYEARAFVFAARPTLQHVFDEALISFETEPPTVTVTRYNAASEETPLAPSNFRRVFRTAGQRFLEGR